MRGAYREGEGRGAMRGEGAPRGSSQSVLSSGGGRAREFRTAATHTAGRRHADDRLEVSHVAAEAVASYAPAEDTAVVVHVLNAHTAIRTVLHPPLRVDLVLFNVKLFHTPLTNLVVLRD